jgi:hypothetical protein
VRLSLIAAACLGALALAAGASAGVPRFALFDVHTGLAASHNPFGDVKVWKQSSALAARAHGATLVRCGAGCTYGAGWLAFVQAPALSAGDVSAAKARHDARLGWALLLTLTPSGQARFARFDTKATLAGVRRGISDALVLVVDGAIVAQPLQGQLKLAGTTLEVPGFTRANALRTAKLFGR